MKSDPYYIRLRFIAVFLVVLSVAFGQNVFADSSVPVRNNTGNKAAVEALFADVPQMVSVARCESTFQQYTSKGTTFTGAGGRYVGVFQIATGHTATAKKLGHDIYTLEGNLGYARYMYDRQGLGPWKGCVKGTVAIAKKPAAKNTTATKKTTGAKTPLLTKNMGVGAKGSEVIALQKILNLSGFYIARSGPGSSGHETNVFNMQTRDALKRFQCINNIVCKGNERSTGYGYMGPSTRAALLKEAKKRGL